MPIKTNITSISPKGQVTIPKKIRDYLKVKPKDKIEFEIEKGIVRLKPVKSLELNFGKVKPKEKPEDFKKIRKFFEKKVGEETGKEV
ncbi:AbrB/MazE/SpoVT family DNA-binding domain-containing protein [Candidatus Aerophobetes bacterium]|nr:AbrB/MazE/SpoVT family DNA-binding domain-containing protein [Candidatus Aerophobetes bacterium]